MKQLLSKIGLIENFTIALPVDRSEFVKVLSANIDKPGLDIFEVFSKSKNAYKGTVSYDSFELKRRRTFFDRGASLIKVSGQIRQKGDELEVDMEVNAFHVMMIPFIAVVAFVLVFFLVATFGEMMSGNSDGSSFPVVALPLMIFQMSIMLGLPYYLLRRSLSSTKYNIERDIFFMMKETLRGKQEV